MDAVYWSNFIYVFYCICVFYNFNVLYTCINLCKTDFDENDNSKIIKVNNFRSQDAEMDETAENHVERLFCNHLFHLECLLTFMKTPPFQGLSQLETIN